MIVPCFIPKTKKLYI